MEEYKIIIRSILFFAVFLFISACKKDKVIPVPDNLFIYDEETSAFCVTGQGTVSSPEEADIFNDDSTGKILSFQLEADNNNYTITLCKYLGYGQWAAKPFFTCSYQLTEKDKPLVFVGLCADRFFWSYTEFYTYIRHLEKDYEIESQRFHCIVSDIVNGNIISHFVIEGDDPCISKFEGPLGLYGNKLFYSENGYFDIGKNKSFAYPEKLNQAILLGNIGKIIYLDKKDRVCLYDIKSGTVERTDYSRKLIYDISYAPWGLYYMTERYFYYSKDHPQCLLLRILGSAYGEYYSPREWYRIDRTTGEEVRLDMPWNKAWIISEWKS